MAEREIEALGCLVVRYFIEGVKHKVVRKDRNNQHMTNWKKKRKLISSRIQALERKPEGMRIWGHCKNGEKTVKFD